MLFKTMAVAFLIAISINARSSEWLPYQNAKVGDWAEYVSIDEGRTEESRETVVKKTDTEVTLEIAVRSEGGQSTRTVTVVFKLDHKPDYLCEGCIEKGTGTQNMKFAGKCMATRWRETEIEFKNPFDEQAKSGWYKSKVWTSKAVPLSGLVRWETTTTDGLGGEKVSTSQLKAFGRK
jgi:hypothetical protein